MPKSTEEITRVKQVCKFCNRTHSSKSRQGIYFRCRYCGGLNPGPKLLNQALEPGKKKTVSVPDGSVPDKGRDSGAKAEPSTPNKSVIDKLLGR